MFVDSNHSGDKVSCRLRSDFLIYVNTALVQWFSKKQSTVKTSMFGAEFIVMKQGIDALRGLRYKLRMTSILHLVSNTSIETKCHSYIYIWTRISFNKEKQLSLLSHGL